jgi:hypothetical protein
MLVAAAAMLALPGASRADALLRALDGQWFGDGFNVAIDSARAQARLDPKKPFQWEAFRIRNVSGEMVVFTIGPRLFIGYLGEDMLTLTSPGLQGARLLRRTGRYPQ